MALSALTLSTTSGVLGEPFEAVISGKSVRSTIDVLSDGTYGFGETNGKVMHPALPAAVNTVVLRETLPGTGTKDTRITIDAYSVDNPAPQPPADGTAVISDADTLSITNSAGADGHDATVAITGNTIGSISFAGTVAMIDDGDVLTVPVTGTYTDTATVTVADGVITNIALS